MYCVIRLVDYATHTAYMVNRSFDFCGALNNFLICIWFASYLLDDDGDLAIVSIFMAIVCVARKWSHWTPTKERETKSWDVKLLLELDKCATIYAEHVNKEKEWNEWKTTK